jgi:hypothetical protein
MTLFTYLTHNIMINSKTGLMYTRNKVPKFQTGNAFSAEEVKPIGYQFETLIYLASSLVFLLNESS